MMTHLDNLLQIKNLCVDIVRNGKPEDIKELGRIVEQKKTWALLHHLQRDLLATFYVVLKNESENKSKLSIEDKLVVIGVLDIVLTHTKLENEVIFFNLFGFLLQDIYDCETHEIKSISEEHKLVVLSCTKSLLNSTTSDLTLTIYTKENGKRLCKMIYVVIEIAIHEKLKSLRIEAINCLMALYKVYSDTDYADPIFRSLVAESFSFFLPGVASCLVKIATKDDKVGYKLIKVAIKAMGRIISLLMQDYKEGPSITPLEQAKSIVHDHLTRPKTQSHLLPEVKKNKLEEYMEGIRNPEWFKKCDVHMARLVTGYRKLTQHPIVEVRKELSEMCNLFMETCFKTMPRSHRYFVEILIILSEDEDKNVSQISGTSLRELRIIFSNDQTDHVLINKIQDAFYETFSEIPTIFNGIDEKEKIAILKLTTGYINLAGQKLQLNDSFRQFMHILVHLCEFEVDISTFNENGIQDLYGGESFISELWKNFKFLKDYPVRQQLTYLCKSLAENNFFDTCADFLITMYRNDEEKREATYLLNEIVLGLKNCKYTNKMELIQPIFNIYIDPDNWDLPLEMKIGEFEENLALTTLRENIQLAALSVDGIGIMADVLEEEFRPFLLKSLFLILSRAGSKQPLIQSAGKRALRNVAQALHYPNVTTLINDNMDYFVFYIERSLKKDDVNRDAFDVMEVVISYGNKATLSNLISIVEEVLVQSCDKFKQKRIDSYLKIFKIFFKSLHTCFDISVPQRDFRTKAEKKEEEEKNFKITGLDNIEEITNFSDDIMGKSAEELYEEDMKRNADEVELENLEPEVEEYKKPEPPYHVKLTVEILKRCLNFLPSKENERKLLVLEILKSGIEIIKDFQDELLPVVHLIWSPLVARFKEFNVPVIISYSVELLSSLARLAKDFIRNRTAKDVLPNILEILMKLSQESYMKDRGSAYRYTQTYKLQITILDNLAYIMTDIDLLDEDIKKTMNVVFVYLNDKQPLPLQLAAVQFFRMVVHYDPNFQVEVNKWLEDGNDKDYIKNLKKIADEPGTE